MSIQTKSSYAYSSGWKYDVFLSFRGEDTRKNFVDHLYAAMNQRGIHVFKDNKELQRGKKISLGLLQAIEQSRFSVIVFSKNYASSTWCLDELVKIVECMATRGQTVIPIFYDVDPSMVRKQTGDFHKAFTQHEKAFRGNMKMVQTWRSSLTEVANLCGWDAKDRHEQGFIREIVTEISSKLSPSTFLSIKNLVGPDSRLEELKMLIGVEYDDVHMIGICGMGGLGKTTISRVTYELMSSKFEGSCFLANVREVSKKVGMVSLQKILLSQILGMKKDDLNIDNEYDGIRMITSRLKCKKVLVVIDDVNDSKQLNKLVGGRDWFSLGSKIIITSRNKNVLISHEVDEIYEPRLLNDDEALQMLISKAFKKDQPSKQFMELSKCVVTYASGLPLALEVLGSFLCGREVHVWDDALKRLNGNSKREILDILQITYEGLEELEKKIFLDISCFFKGEHRSYVTRILENCGFFPNIGIDILIDKSLLTILDGEILWMHDLLQEMGRQIVKRESLEEPEKRSRLWEEADICHVLTKNTGTESIEGIMIEKDLHFAADAKAFSKMVNLRLLKILHVKLPKGLEYLPNKLQLLVWHGYLLKSLPSSFQPDKIVHLCMQYSHIEQLWKGIKPLNKLTSIHLQDCPNLREAPDLTWAPNLENLFLNGCAVLRGFHSPLIVLNKLISLEVSNCPSLTTLPKKIYLESLEILSIVNCPKVKKFPEVVRRMERLRYFCSDGTAIRKLPSSIELLSMLEELIITNNNNLLTLPSTINSLVYLQLLDLSGCSNLTSLPWKIDGLKCLRTLILCGCSKLENIAETLGQVESLEKLDLSEIAITQPVWSIIFQLKNLKELSFQSCKGSKSKSRLSHFPVSLIPRRRLDSMALMLPSSSSLCSLTRLDLSDCNIGEAEIPSDFFASLSSLETLNLSKNNFVSLPASMKCMTNLKKLSLKDCKMLQSMVEVPSSVNELSINGCASLERFSDAINIQHLYISCVNCYKLFGGNHLMFSLLKAFLKARQNPREYFNMVFPGSDISEWLRYQAEGSSIRVGMPPNLYNNKLVGFIVCSVFVVHIHPPILYNYESYGIPRDFPGTHELHLHVYVDGGIRHPGFYTTLDSKSGRAVSEHVWLLYFPYERYLRDGERENKHLDIEFSFEEERGPGLEVKRCGVHPIYEQDVEKFIQMMNKSSDSTSWYLEEFAQDCAGSDADDATTKLSLIDLDDEDPQLFK